MENASKALMIAGAIIVCIMIVAVGMYINSIPGGVLNVSFSSLIKKTFSGILSKNTI